MRKNSIHNLFQAAAFAAALIFMPGCTSQTADAEQEVVTTTPESSTIMDEAVDSVPAKTENTLSENENTVSDKNNYIPFIKPDPVDEDDEDVPPSQEDHFDRNAVGSNMEGDETFYNDEAAEPISDGHDGIYDYPAEYPEFPGGEKALLDFMTSNIVYPQDAMELGIQGKVYVQFVVTPEGNIEDVVILRSVHPSLDKEAMRVIKLMPRWEPGKDENGDAVFTRYRMPVRFQLK